jgi:Zn-dependent protease
MGSFPEILFNIFVGAIGLLIAIDVHECCHAWMAYRLGDYSARSRVTLNPIAHLDPVGTLFMGINLLYAMVLGSSLPLIGWGKPVNVHPHLFRTGGRKGMGIVALAGPVANIAAAVVFALPIRLGFRPTGAWIYVFRLIYMIVWTNIGIAAFNLIPIPPLDGFSVLMWIVNSIRASWAYRFYAWLSRLEVRGFQPLMILILADWILPISIIGTLTWPMFRLATLIALGGG